MHGILQLFSCICGCIWVSVVHFTRCALAPKIYPSPLCLFIYLEDSLVTGSQALLNCFFRRTSTKGDCLAIKTIKGSIQLGRQPQLPCALPPLSPSLSLCPSRTSLSRGFDFTPTPCSHILLNAQVSNESALFRASDTRHHLCMAELLAMLGVRYT